MKQILKKQALFLIILSLSVSVFAQRTIEGTVKDAKTGETLIGVTVLVKGTSSGTITGVTGNYRLESDQLSDSSVIVFSYIGYADFEQQAGSLSLLNAELNSGDYLLDELVVIGYGTAKKRNVLGAVSSVKSNDLTMLPVAGIAQAMQGRAAGVVVTQNTGAPGDGVSIRIRGTGSISSGNEPLYIVDGIAAADGINILSPGDIESITVLKDASSAAIYGSRANNGVVIVTTKKGLKGKAKVTYRGQTGIQKATNLTKMVNTKDYVTIYNEAATNDNALLPPGLARNLISPADAAKFDDVNYVDELFTVAPINSHELSVSGGNESTTYMISTSYFNQKGIIKGAGYSRGTARIDLNTDVSKWLTTGISMLAGLSSTDIVGSSGDGAGGNGGSIIRYAFFRNPGIPVRFPDGTFVDRPAEYFGSQVYDSFLGDGYNPIGMSEYNDNNRKDDSYLGKAYVIAKISKKIKFTSNIGMDYKNSFSRRFNPAWGTFNRVNGKNSLNIGNLQVTNLTINNVFNYETKIGEDHNFSAMIGSETISDKGKALYADDSDFPVQQTELIYIGKGIGNKNSSQSEYASSLASFFGRVMYDYKEKYYLSGTARRDGSSRFTGDNVWGNFYSIAGGWLISEEEFLKNTSWLESLKLRVGYGGNGNQAISLYAFTDLISPYYNYAFGGISNPGYAQSSLGNKDVQWETSYQFNAGFDAALYRGSFTVSLDYFRKITQNMLVTAPNPPSVGYAAPAWINSGSVLNSGVELEANYRKNSAKWKYSIGGNLTFLHNEVLNLDAPLFAGTVESGVTATRTEVGHPIGSFYLLEMDGIFQNSTEVLLSAYQGSGINPGDVKFKDNFPDGRIDNKDRKYLGSAMPKLIAGINLAGNYGNFDVSMFFQGSYGNKIYMQINQDIEGFYRGFTVTQRYFDERWTGEGSSDTQPRPSWTSKSNNARPSSRFLEDGSYLRLKNLQIGYTIPSAKLNFSGAPKTRFYISGTNLFTLTKYSGLDPEMTVSDNSRSEGDAAAGIDWGTYPSAMTLMFGIDITF